MKRFLSITLVLALLLTTATVSSFANQGNGNGNTHNSEKANTQNSSCEFKDTGGHWGKNAIAELQSSGILQGYTDGTFRPDDVLTQDQLAVILDLLLDYISEDDDETTVTDDEDTADDAELTSEEENTLNGVPAWARESVREGFEKNYMHMNRYHSGEQCSRLTALVAIAKALDLEPAADTEDNAFTDAGLMSEEDYGYILALYEEGYISGYPDGSFNPNAMITRAQIAVIIDKILGDETDPIEDTADVTAPTWDNDSAITASAIKADSVTLSWTGAEDEVGVVLYRISYTLDEEAQIKYVKSATSARIGGLEAETEYTFEIEARDAAGNWSNDGPSVTITTIEAETAADTTAPTWTTDAAITVTSTTVSAVTLFWPDAVDNVAVKEYKVYLNGSLVQVLDADKNAATISNLTADTEYTFTLKARDAAGNFSAALRTIYITEE